MNSGPGEQKHDKQTIYHFLSRYVTAATLSRLHVGRRAYLQPHHLHS
jgi:hypothetical protein